VLRARRKGDPQTTSVVGIITIDPPMWIRVRDKMIKTDVF
jgi:hypothetical protein